MLYNESCDENSHTFKWNVYLLKFVQTLFPSEERSTNPINTSVLSRQTCINAVTSKARENTNM